MFKKGLTITLSALITMLVLNSCATLPQNTERTASSAYMDTDDTGMGQHYRDLKIAHPGESGFVPLGSGLDAFVARAIMANAAERSIDAQYYLLHGDLTGLLFIDQLIKAADRGVRVRLLVDDMDLEGRDLGSSVLDSHPNIEVRIFNPFSRKTGRVLQFVTRFGKVTRRMHNKSFTVDNQATVVGGRNIGDEYFDAHPDMAFADLDVYAIGPVVGEVSSFFDKYWNSELAYPATVLRGTPATPEEIEQKKRVLAEFVASQSDSQYIQALRNSNLAHKIRGGDVDFEWGMAEVVADEPEKILHDISRREYHLTPKLEKYTAGVTDEFIIFSPYFVPGKKGTAFLSDLSESGVRVRILTNSLASTDVGVVHAGYARYRMRLLRAGVELYEMNKKLSRNERKEKKGPYGSSKASLHTKSFIFDREHVFIGSLNLDPRSVFENTEIGVVLTSPPLAEGMAAWFDDNIDTIAFRLELHERRDGSEGILWHGMVDGKPKTFNVDPFTGFWRRFGVDLVSLLPIESQL